jgi:hypothetical protein
MARKFGENLVDMSMQSEAEAGSQKFDWWPWVAGVIIILSWLVAGYMAVQLVRGMI